MAGLSGRLARLEARLSEAVLDVMAKRMAGETRQSIADCRAEMQVLMHQLARLGPNPDPRAVAGLVARRYGSDEERVYRDLVAKKKERRGR